MPGKPIMLFRKNRQRWVMVQFVGVENVITFLGSRGVETVLREMAAYIEADFKRWPDFEKVARIPSHSDLGVIELMPTSDGQLYSFKYVNGHPGNTRTGHQTVTAFGVLADVGTGYPIFMSEMTLLTALRTAATSALVATYLARPDAKTMAIIGLGAQSEFQAMAFRALLGINRLQVFDIDPAAFDKFRKNLEPLGFDIVASASAEAAVLGADVITTVTADKANATILSDNMIGAGVHINAVGGDCPGKTALHRDILTRADVFVEFPPQTRIEGEIQQMPADFEVTELWQVMRGEKAGRTHPDQITLFDSVGFATEDFSALRYLRDQVQGTAHVIELDLLAEPTNPRDLFGELSRGMPQNRPMLRSIA
jgi:ornithine cyclodeaminase